MRAISVFIMDLNKSNSVNGDIEHNLSTDTTTAESADVASDLLAVNRPTADPLPIQPSTPKLAHSKRKRSVVTDEMTPAKRQAVKDEGQIDIDVREKCLGDRDVPLSSLKSPPKGMELRPVSTKHKDKIKEGLKKTTVCSTVIPVLLDEDASYYTLGGNHLVTAMKELRDDHGFQSFNSIRAKVYKDLNETEALRVSSLHNDGTHCILQMTLKDKVKMCRRQLYTLCGCDEGIDEPPPSIKEWREQCATIFGKTTDKKEVKSLEPTFQVALYSKRCFTKLKEIFDLYEEPCPKQTVFMKLQGLHESSKFKLLSEVVDGKHTLKSMGKEAERLKKLLVVQEELRKMLSVSSWEEAEKKFPKFTTEEALWPFTGYSSKEEIPRSFLKFVKKAQEWHKQHVAIQSDDAKHEPDEMSSGNSRTVSLSADQDFPRIDGFDVADLIIADMEKSTDSFENVHNTTKAHGQVGCTVAIKVSTGTVSTVKTLLAEYGLHELTTFYKYDPSARKMKIMIAASMRKPSGENCHQKDNCQQEDNSHQEDNCHQEDILVTEDLMTHTIEKYSDVGDWIIYHTRNSEAEALAFQHRRNYVALLWDEEDGRVAKAKIVRLSPKDRHPNSSQEDNR